MDKNEWLFLGEQIYNIMLEYEGIRFIICPCSIGDTVIIGAYISTYKRVHSYNKVVLVVKKQQVELVKLFKEVDDVLPIDDIQMTALRIYVCVNKRYNFKNVLYGHFEPTDLTFSSFKVRRELSFVNEYKATILDIPLNSQIDPVILPKVDDSKYRGGILLLPYAKTFEMLENSFWEELACEYANKGMKVFCNIGPGEKCIRNTIPCEISIIELCGVAHSFKRIMGLRSGIMDALSLTGCAIDVIFTGVVSNIYESCYLDGVRLYSDISELNKNSIVRNYAYVNGKEHLLIKNLLEIDCCD